MPEDDVFVELKVSKLLLFVHIEDLKDVSFASLHWSLKSNDVLFEMHDGAIDLSPRTADKVELVEEFDDGELRSAGLVGVTNRDVAFGLEMGDVELEELGI